MITPPAEKNSPARHQAGFTMIEVMLVIALMAVVAVAVVVNIRPPGPERELETEAKRFAALMEMAIEQAVFTSQQLGVVLDAEGYRFLRLDKEVWVELENDPIFRPRKLPEYLRTKLELEGLPWLEEDRLTAASDSLYEGLFEEDEELLLPQIFIYSYGEFSPFSVTFRVESDFDEIEQQYLVNGVYDEVQLLAKEEE